MEIINFLKCKEKAGIIVFQFFSVITILWSIILCCEGKPTATAAGCLVYSLYDGEESKPWPWSVGTHAAISLLPEYPSSPLKGLHINLNGHQQDHVVYFDQYDNVVCRDGGRQESSFHQTPTNSSTQLVYQWYHASIAWHGGVLSINGHDVCSGMHLEHGTYNITLKYSEASGFAAFGCHQGCPIWENSELNLYNKPLPSESTLARIKYFQQPAFISLIVDRCYSKLQHSCNKTITINTGVGNYWTKIGWRNIVEVNVGDVTQSLGGHGENDVEMRMQVFLKESNVLWTFLTPTCTKEMAGIADAPFHDRQAEVLHPDCKANQLLFYITIGLGTALVGVIIILFTFCIITNKRWNSETSYSRVDHICDMNMSIITQDDQKLQK